MRRALVVLVSVGACYSDGWSFVCTTDSQCGDGACKDGRCAVADGTCASGFRFADLSGSASMLCWTPPPPACGNTFVTVGVPLANLNTMNRQASLLGVSSDASSVLYLAATTGCVANGANLILAERAGATYMLDDITTVPALSAFSKQEETMTVTADGLTLVGVDSTNARFLASTRSAPGVLDFRTAAAGDFATINSSIPAGASVLWPLESVDGLAFFYKVLNATPASVSGIYESVRTSTAEPFPVGTKLDPLVQTFEAISGISSDRLTAFVGLNYHTQILTRSSPTSAFEFPATSSPPGFAFRITQLAGCATLVGTCEPGGCTGEVVCTWNSN